MKYYITLLAAVLLFSCTKDRITGSGPVVTETRTVAEFSKIHINGSTTVYITQGAVASVEVKAFSNLLPYFETKVSNGNLMLGYKELTNVRNDNVEVFITMPMIEGISINGSSEVTTQGMFSASTEIVLSVNGSGTITMQQAQTNYLKAKISGSGEIGGYGIAAKEAEIDISGSGDVNLTVQEKLHAIIRGSGEINYKGSPTSVITDISGSGKVTKR